MFTYFLMGLPFLAIVLVLDLLILKTKVVKTKNCWVAIGIMILLTAIFDQILAGLPIVHYTEAKILGLQLVYVPIEDFMYTIVAVIGLASIWEHYEQRIS